MYNPDRWVIVEIENPKHGKLHKVLGGWSGGYLDSDNWRMSSGLEKIEEDGDYYLMHNYSGSVYKCHKNSEGVTVLSGSILGQMEDQAKKLGEGYSVKIVTVEEFNGTRSTGDGR